MNVNIILKMLVPIIPLVIAYILITCFKFKQWDKVFSVTCMALVALYFLYIINGASSFIEYVSYITIIIIYLILYFHIGFSIKNQRNIINMLMKNSLKPILLILPPVIINYLIYIFVKCLQKQYISSNEVFVRYLIILYLLVYLILALIFYILDIIIKKNKKNNKIKFSLFELVEASLIIVLLFHFFAYNFLSTFGVDSNSFIYKVIPLNIINSDGFKMENVLILNFFLNFEMLLIGFRKQIVNGILSFYKSF